MSLGVSGLLSHSEIVPGSAFASSRLAQGCCFGEGTSVESWALGPFVALFQGPKFYALLIKPEFERELKVEARQFPRRGRS